MIRMFARDTFTRQIDTGEDRVFASLALPSGSRVNDISIDLRAHQLNAIGIGVAMMWAIEGWIVPVIDPDAATAIDTIWDNLVPKDTDVEVIDLDTGAVDATPFYEPGEPDFSGMMDVGLRPERIYHAHGMTTIGEDSFVTFQDNQTPFSVLWIPKMARRIRVRKNYAVKQPSVLMFAFANPSLDDTTATGKFAPAEAEWGQLKYIGHVLERALLHLFGVTEMGAETPWEEATALLKKFLEPDPFEDSGGSFGSASWRAFSMAMFDLSVEGRLGNTTITTGR